jgi:RNA polymerase sigma-32 factor
MPLRWKIREIRSCVHFGLDKSSEGFAIATSANHSGDFSRGKTSVGVLLPMTGSSDSLAVRSLLRRPTMTAERERGLLRSYRTSTDDMIRQTAFSELWQGHSKFVVAVARQYQRPDLSMADLVVAGQLGLHAAIERFDPDQSEIRLAEYALDWVNRSIQEYVERHAGNTDSAVPTPVQQLMRSATRLFDDARRACQREGSEPTDAELCARVGARVGLPAEEVAKWLPLARSNVTLAQQMDPAALRRRMIALSEQILGARERIVFVARCLPDRRRVRRVESLASELGVTRERICELEGSARRKIAAALTRDGLLAPALLDTEPGTPGAAQQVDLLAPSQ